MSILISGSLAYDYIMDFPDTFKNHILPDQIHILNVCFVVEKLEKNFGGCSGNIGYTMKLLGSEPIIFSPLGTDAGEYLDYLKSLGLNTNYIKVVEDKLTSAAHITTDKDDNQIIAYYNGAGDAALEMNVADVKEKLDLALITPTQKQAMIKHAKECFDKKIPFVFDPSHQLTAFDERELMQVIGQAKFYIGNDYEMKLTQEKTGWDMQELLNHVEVVITTLGDKGSIITTKDGMFEIESCEARSVDDPTGAGDAYRAGFFAAFAQGHNLKTCGQVGSVAAVYAVEHYGTQNHTFSKEDFVDRYEDAYNEKIEL